MKKEKEMITPKEKLRITRDKMITLLFGFPHSYSIICVDTTNRCNLQCKGCYYFDHELKSAQELPIKEWIPILEKTRKKYRWMNYAAWVGGEPLLRHALIKETVKIFSHNMIVTNGTLPLIPFDNAVYIVSVDGTKKYDAMIKGKEHYEFAKKNIRKSPEKVSLNMVINSVNHGCLKDFVAEWREEPNIKQIYLSFHTPQKNKNDELWTGWHLRDRIIDRIQSLKIMHKEFLAVSETALSFMYSDIVRRTLIPNCVCRRGIGLVLNAAGEKRTCVLGEKADCEKCGNWEMMHATSVILQSNMETVNLIFGLFGANIS